MKAIREADTLHREDPFAIQNTVKDCLATGSAPTEYRAMIIAKVARLHRYIYTPGTCALVHVNNIENGTLIVADTWLLAGENPDLAPDLRHLSPCSRPACRTLSFADMSRLLYPFL